MTATANSERDRLIRQVLSHSNPARLANAARAHHGWVVHDGWFGVTYATDQDEYDLAQGNVIPEGWVELYGFQGNPDGYEIRVTERDYLAVLNAFLTELGALRETEEVALLLRTRL